MWLSAALMNKNSRNDKARRMFRSQSDKGRQRKVREAEASTLAEKETNKKCETTHRLTNRSKPWGTSDPDTNERKESQTKI